MSRDISIKESRKMYKDILMTLENLSENKKKTEYFKPSIII